MTEDRNEVETMIEDENRNREVTAEGETRQNRAGEVGVGGPLPNFPDQSPNVDSGPPLTARASIVGLIGPTGVERMVPGMRVFLERWIEVPGKRVDQREGEGLRMEIRAYSQSLRDALKARAEGDRVRVTGTFAKREWRGRDGGWKQVVYIDAETIE